MTESDLGTNLINPAASAGEAADAVRRSLSSRGTTSPWPGQAGQRPGSGLAYGRERQFHRFLRPLDLTVDRDTANSTDVENPACISSSSLRPYSMFSIACLAVFIAVAHFR